MCYLTRQPSKRKRPHLKVMCLPVSSVMEWCNVAAKSAAKMEVSVVQHGFTWKSRSLGSLGPPERQDTSKGLINCKASCCTLRRWITTLKVSIQNSTLSTLTPQRRLPHEALWHHVGATIGITLDKNGSLYDPAGTESCDMQIRLVKSMYVYIYIWDYGGHQLRLKCAQVHHHSPAGTFTQVPGGCLRCSPTPPGPRWSPAVYIYIYIYL